MKLNHFKDIQFLPAIKALFNELKVPMNYVADEPTTAEEILKDTYKDNETFQLVDDVYFVGMIDDAAFEGNQSLDTDQIKSDYDGILVFGITLHQRHNNLLPTRAQLAEISRAFNREFYYTPVVLVFKYQNDEANFIAFANTERLQYKQAWREGEKAGKVSLLRDINIEKPHRGHEDIINQLRVPTSGTKAVDSFAKLYTYWQEVFSVSVLNKKFYQELSNWYFWAVKHVTFPNRPTTETVVEKYGKFDQQKLDELIQEHNATNVIRLLTRLLFTWFIKEKKLIPEALFDLDALQKEILNDISPYHEEGTMFAQANKDSVYYKAILQNLFFASLNCPIEADGIDNRTRGFRGDGYGTHRGIDYLMRYKKYFKDPEAFLEIMNKTVPFLNGGLFECLDDKYQNLYIDGFSDQMTKGEQLIVPDYLFFGTAQEVDLSAEYGVKNKGTKQAAVKGLINILKSYKFTITENTPIEEDVALDPELLGKVFENLLASYNPETKTTARKQTGSFYTPREIVNYMVDESLIAYLKNAVSDWDIEEKELDEKLHQLTSFDPVNPFEQSADLSKRIVKALDECTILDPACGSGAFPMGILQKMVHMLQKLDPQNEYWKEVQLNKAISDTEEAYGIEDKKEREQKLIEINDAFDEQINDPDYARKLYLIENCIYGVDIQPIATQIAKLRFFISLVVDQKATDDPKDNFNIRPLPNLETKFVTANTLIGIEKPKAQTNLFTAPKIKELEAELKKIRHKLFSARTKDTKIKYRQKDEELRSAIAKELVENGWQSDTAEKLTSWDPYDQNASSPFFDSEWMFDISEGFDLVIGNPPYIQLQANEGELANKYGDCNYSSYTRTGDIYALFYESGINLLSPQGHLCFITSNKWMRAKYGEKLRSLFCKYNPITLLDLGPNIFETATVDTNILLIQNSKNQASLNGQTVLNHQAIDSKDNFVQIPISKESWTILSKEISEIRALLESKGKPLSEWSIEINRGILTGLNEAFIITKEKKEELIHEDSNNSNIIRPILRGKDVKKYRHDWRQLYLINTHNGLKNQQERVNINDFPALKSHLDQFLPKLSIRQDKGATPYNLRNCAYLRDFEKPKIIYQEMVQESCFYFDSTDHFYCNDTARIITGDHLLYLTSLLNSKLFFFAVKVFYGGGALGSSGVRMKHTFFEKFPALFPDNHSILEFFTLIIQYHKQKELGSELFENIVDALVFNFYFTDHMKEREIDVLQFVERDIEKVLQDREFDSLSDPEKEKVIEQLHATWSHPDNEVRNRMKLFAVRSPEILKPILES